MKKITLSLLILSSFLFANKNISNNKNHKENNILNKINDFQKKDLRSKNYENFNMETISFYSKVDDSNIYLKLLQKKVNNK